MSLLLGSITVATASPCAGTAAALRDAADAVVAAFETDLASVPTAVARLDAAKAAVCEVVAPSQVRPVFLALALRELTDEALSMDRLLHVLRALHAADPGSDLSELLAPPGSLLDTSWRQVQLEPLEPQPHRLPRGDWWVDGMASGIAPLDRATIVQQVQGEQVTTWFVLGEGPPEAWVELRARRLSHPLLATAGAAAALAVVSAGLAGRLKEMYVDGDAANVAEGEQLERWNEVTTRTSVGLGATSAGLAASALAVWRW